MKDDYIITLDSLEICRCIKKAAKEEIGTLPKSKKASPIDVKKPKACVSSKSYSSFDCSYFAHSINTPTAWLFHF